LRSDRDTGPDILADKYNMRVPRRYLFSLALMAAPAYAATSLPFDSNWRFLKGDPAAAEQPQFDDGPRRTVDVPHDWAIEGPFDEKNPAGGAGAFLPGGVGWYRKSFILTTADAKRRVFVDFDGVTANSDVWINGFHLGKRLYGYVSFRYELTRHLNFGAKPNVLAVRADNSQQPASRWYPGAGIYQHVWLVSADAVHLGHWATFVTTPKVSAGGAAVHVRTAVENQSDAVCNALLEITLIAPNGKTAKTASTAPQAIAAGKNAEFEREITLRSPDIWDINRPALYRVMVKVRDGKTALDEETVPFGIREFRFDAGAGFWLNGRNFKLKGVALHGDAGGLGVAVPLSAWQRRLETLRELGVNAIRTSHNPVAPEFLDLLDRMGFLVMDEMFDCWTVGKTPYDYHLCFHDWSQTDLRDTVMRDRNHPSIILYSAGNEIYDTPKAGLAKEILGGLVSVFHAADPTRPVTQALFRPNVSHHYDDGLADMLDVVGQNYRENKILAAHAQKPARKIVGTESRHGRAVWLAMRGNAAFSGQFLWAGIDYLGEAGTWPGIASPSGLLDRTGAIKPLRYERQSWRSEKPVVQLLRRVAPERRSSTDPGYEESPRRPAQTLFPDWTPANLAPHNETVEVYSNCPDVELSLNGKSLGSKQLPADASPRVWQVSFEPGAIQGICKGGPRNPLTVVVSGGVIVKETFIAVLRTAGKAAKIILSAGRSKLTPGWDDVAHVIAAVTDGQGVVVPVADNEVAFQVSGPGSVAAVNTADNASREPFQASSRRAYQGACIAVIRATASKGRIIVNASSAGLAASSVTIEAVSK
jgi:beta-galactosidase